MSEIEKSKKTMIWRIRDLSFLTAFRLKAVPSYDFLLTVHKPVGWSLLTPFEIFESGTLWTVMRTPSRKMFGLKLRSVRNTPQT